MLLDFSNRVQWTGPVEHSMSIAAGVYRGSLCERVSAIEGYFSIAYPQLYERLHWMHNSDRTAMRTQHDHEPDNVSEDIVTLAVVELVNYYCTFLWSFMDVFIVAIALCLRERFWQLNEHLARHRGMVNGANQISP